MASGGNAPHWSRWERSATTFGPAGRIALTAGFFVSVLVAGASGLIVYVLLSPLLGWVLLPAIWAKGWVVPGEPDTPPLPDTPRVEPSPTPPPTRAMLGWRIVGWAAASASLAAFAYGPLQVKAAVLMAATLVGLYAFWRGFFTR